MHMMQAVASHAASIQTQDLRETQHGGQFKDCHLETNDWQPVNMDSLEFLSPELWAGSELCRSIEALS